MSEHYLQLAAADQVIAPDGSTVRILLDLPTASTAHFEFPAGSVSVAVRHRTVDEVWFFLTGRGRFWTSAGPEAGIDVAPGSSVIVRAGERFQVRSVGPEALRAFGVTSPRWPGDGEAELVDGPWIPTLEPGPH